MQDSHNLLRPETMESLFVLWRVTRDAQYRRWGWAMLRAWEKFCRVATGGYTSLDSVLQVHCEASACLYCSVVHSTLCSVCGEGVSRCTPDMHHAILLCVFVARASCVHCQVCPLDRLSCSNGACACRCWAKSEHITSAATREIGCLLLYTRLTSRCRALSAADPGAAAR